MLQLMFMWFIALLFLLVSCEKRKTNVDRDSRSEERTELVYEEGDDDQEKYRQFRSQRLSKAKDSLWFLKLVSDSTCVLYWNADSVQRSTEQSWPLYMGDRIWEVWRSEEFIYLEYGGGSDTWYGLVLPRKDEGEPIDIPNPMAQDPDHKLIVYETWDRDTVLVIHYLESGEEKYVIESLPCQSGINHYCMDSVMIVNGAVIYKWCPETGWKCDKWLYRRVEIE